MNSIKRPIVFICNDIYCKPLGQLRKEALLITVRKCDEKKIQERIKLIAEMEGIVIKEGLIKTIIKESNSDIRVCVNLLQFISYNKGDLSIMKDLSFEGLKTLGMKDQSSNFFKIWQTVFSSEFKENALKLDKLTDYYFGSGDLSLVNDGIYHNYHELSTSIADPAKTAELLELMSLDDTVAKKIASRQQFSLMNSRVVAF